MDDKGRDAAEAFCRLVDTVRRLRGPSGCSWDRKQTVSSLTPFMLEEAYEAADAAARGDMGLLRAELGDLLLHVVMSAVICQEGDHFTLVEVMDGITEKLVRRHPHVFGVGSDLSPEEVERQWEAIKSSEKGEEGFFGSIPLSMPALQTAWRVQQRASEVGFDWPDAGGAREKVLEELEEFEQALSKHGREEQEMELGDLFFSLVNYYRLLGFQPETVLRASNLKFIRRFTRMEGILRERGLELTEADMEAMDDAWQKAKLD
ncbi:MAG: hypothetical protein AVO35_01140 [Candidatus Aegiribacteria sp. MLS_C]|nr:MAG: hypothetical protein AVO35_01140 [Candidatus Aegiribacteria sp. MLS_C]